MSVVPVLIITLRNTLRILGKAFIVGGAVFYSYDKGIWSSGEHSENHAKLIKKQAEENIVSNIPFHKVRFFLLSMLPFSCSDFYNTRLSKHIGMSLPNN